MVSNSGLYCKLHCGPLTGLWTVVNSKAEKNNWQTVTVISGLFVITGRFCLFAANAQSGPHSEDHSTHCLKHFPAVPPPWR